jgi:hypothetical protein
MGRIIHGTDYTSNTWEGKDNTWEGKDNTWEGKDNTWEGKDNTARIIVCARAENKPPETLFKPPDIAAQLQYT